jgi:hypothetical protein
MGLQQAWRVVSSAHLRSVVDTVRTRVLDLALAFERVSPDAGDRSGVEPPAAMVQTIVNNHIYGGAANVAVGGSSVHQEATNVIQRGDRSSLFAGLRDAGVQQADLDALAEALDADGVDPGSESAAAPGPAVQSWLGRLALRTGSLAGKIATGAAGTVVAGLIKAYFGI